MATLSSKTGLPSFSQSITEINYFLDGGFERGVNGQAPVGWTQYTDAAAAIPVDGTGGAFNSSVPMLCSNSSPIRGSLSAVITKDASNRQGIGYAYDFTISPADKGLTTGVSFEMQTSANFASGDVVFYVYDVTNSTLITPRNTSLTKMDNYGHFYSDFGLTSGTQYRFILHIASVNASAWTLKLDTMVNTTTKTAVPGAPIDDFRALVFAVPSGLGSGSATNSASFRRVGSSMELRLRTLKDAVGGSGAASVIWTMPAGYTISLASIPASQMIGTGDFTGTNFGPVYEVVAQSSTTFALRKGGTATNYQGVDATANGEFNMQLFIPIVEWQGASTNYGPGANKEYAYPTGTVDADSASDGSATGYGQQGAAWAVMSDLRNKYIRWQTPPQPGDMIICEASQDNGASWSIDVAPWAGNAVSTSTAGIKFLSTTNGVTRFQVGRYAEITPSAWSASNRIRFQKFNPSAPVGFGPATATQQGLVSREVASTTFTIADGGKVNLTGTGVFGPASYVRVGNLVTCTIASITGYSITSAATLRTYVILSQVGLPGTTAERSNTMSGTMWVADASDRGLTGRISYASVDSIIVEWTSNTTMSASTCAIYNIRFSYFMA